MCLQDHKWTLMASHHQTKPHPSRPASQSAWTGRPAVVRTWYNRSDGGDDSNYPQNSIESADLHSWSSDKSQVEAVVRVVWRLWWSLWRHSVLFVYHKFFVLKQKSQNLRLKNKKIRRQNMCWLLWAVDK